MAKKTYSQDWSIYNRSQENELPMFMETLAGICKSVADDRRKSGSGRQKLPSGDMLFMSALKVYSTFSLRRFRGMADIASKMGHIGSVCSYSTVSNHMRTERMFSSIMHAIRLSCLPLRDEEDIFAVDSSGFSTCRFGRYFSFRHGKDRKYHKWVKAHVICGVRSNIITDVRISGQNEGDSRFFAPLVDDTSDMFKISEVLADKAYCSRRNYEFVRTKGGSAFIPFKAGFTGKSRGSYEWMNKYRQFVKDPEGFMGHYHKRSNAETVFHMIKTKFRDGLMSRDETAQRNEVLLKVLCHNICVLIQENYKGGIDLKNLCLITKE
jgi:transposase